MINDEMKVAAVKAYAEVDGKCRPAAMQKALEAALPFLPIAGDGKVKALEWRDGYRDSNVKTQQASSERLYQVRELAGVIWLDVGNEQTIYPSVEAAKAAAQSDYEARVLSALSPSSPGKDGGQEVEAVGERALLKRMSDLLDDLSPEDTIGFSNGVMWIDVATVEEIRTAAYPPNPQPALTEAVHLLEEVKNAGLIYWEPNTDRGHIAKAMMLSRINDFTRSALSVPAAAVVGEQLRTMLEQAYKEGFEASGEGFNAEYHHDFETDNEWLADRDIAVSGLIDAAPSAPDGWQPIETAPKDGATIWVLDEIYGKPWHYECNWNGIEWYHGFGVAWPDARPTHWRPLPAPPALGGKP